MISSSIKWAAHAAYLSSDRLITANNSLSSEFKSKLRDALFDYQNNIESKLRNEDADLLIELYKLGDETVSVNQHLSELAFYFLDWQGNRFEVKPKLLDEWLSLLALIDGSWIIAQAYVDLIKGHNISVDDVITSVSLNQCMIALCKGSPHKKYADNHVHMGGHGHTGSSLLNFALYFESNHKSVNWPRRSEYTLFESGKYNKNDLPSWVALLGDKLCVSAFDREELNSDVELKDVIDLKHNAVPFLNRSEGESSSQRLLIAANQLHDRSSTRWILFCTGLLALDHQAHDNLSKFIRVSNILRNYMIVSGIGLGQFVEFFRFKTRKYSSNHLSCLSQKPLQMDMDRHVSREFRVSPNVLIDSDNLAADAKKFKKELEKVHQQECSEQIHFVIHFSRSGVLQCKRQEKRRSEIKSQVEVLQQFTGSVTHSDYESIQLGEKDNSSFDLRKSIRGYDVAGNENQLPIEVFAPALRVLRSSKHASQGVFSTRFERPFLTVHAGEDFSHLLSGLRSIDETVTFCDYQKGDRIGHGLALGQSPRKWALRQQLAYLTVGEHLDNLVWCFQKALEVTQKVTQFTGVLHLLQEKISYWSSYLYGETISCNEQYQAWLLRRNCPNVLKVQQYPKNREEQPFVDPKNASWNGWVIDHDKLTSQAINKISIKLWKQYLFSAQDEDFAKRNEIITINCILKLQQPPFGIENGLKFDSISSAEIELYEAIQDLIMEQYARKGIVIEACPTSNIYIGRFKHYHEHPIYRWNPPEQDWLREGGKFNKFGLRRGSVPVCINTDDSALMPTTIRNEHRIVMETAMHHFDVGANRAEDWIDRIREKGVEVFLDNHLNWVK